MTHHQPESKSQTILKVAEMVKNQPIWSHYFRLLKSKDSFFNSSLFNSAQWPPSLGHFPLCTAVVLTKLLKVKNWFQIG